MRGIVPNRVAPPLDLTYLGDRFWSKVAVGSAEECWLWKLSVGSHGYGQIWDRITNRLTHRVAWELTFGSIPSGLT